MFTIFPAIDLRNGQVVRLQEGDPNRQTTFGDDPVAVANQWVDAGADWIHVVNLDGAFGEAGNRNWQVLPELVTVNAQIQFGGGIRELADVERVLQMGVARVVIGTAAIENPAMVAAAIEQFGPERVAVGIDARDGEVKTRGWLAGTAVSPIALAQRMASIGVNTIIYTDISRDGIFAGVNAEATGALAEQCDLNVIASGGVASIEDVQRVSALAHKGVGGVIIGRALYEGKVNLAELLALTNEF